MSRLLVLLGYLPGLLRIAWHSRSVIRPALALWADVGNVRTARCFRREDRDAFCLHWWTLMSVAGFTCDSEQPAVQGDQGGMPSPQRRADQVTAPQRVQWPDDAGKPWDK